MSRKAWRKLDNMSKKKSHLNMQLNRQEKKLEKRNRNSNKNSPNDIYDIYDLKVELIFCI